MNQLFMQAAVMSGRFKHLMRKVHAMNFAIAAMVSAAALTVSCDDNYDAAMKWEALPPEYLIHDVSDTGVPVPGNDGIITTGAVGITSIQLIWAKATDREIPQNQLEYRVYRSGGNDIATPEAAAEHGDVVADWARDFDAVVAPDLTPGTTYYFNVVVRDGSGRMAAYVTVSATSASDALYLFNAGQHGGNLTTPFTASARADVDTLCENARSESYPHLPCLNVRTFISLNDADDIERMPANFGVPIGRRVIGPSGLQIADRWADLLDGSINEMLVDAGITNMEWWSGSDEYGSYLAGESCNAWTSDDKDLDGKTGAPNRTSAQWMNYQERKCDRLYFVLCVCW